MTYQSIFLKQRNETFIARNKNTSKKGAGTPTRSKSMNRTNQTARPGVLLASTTKIRGQERWSSRKREKASALSVNLRKSLERNDCERFDVCGSKTARQEPLRKQQDQPSAPGETHQRQAARQPILGQEDVSESGPPKSMVVAKLLISTNVDESTQRVDDITFIHH